jgi:osmotically inducible protein OsmC
MHLPVRERPLFLHSITLHSASFHHMMAAEDNVKERKGRCRMAEITRSGTSTWKGDLKSGSGVASVGSGLFSDATVTYASRFEQGSGTSPEELVGAAHAACYSMALANSLSEQGFTPERVTTQATVVLEGLKITKIHLTTDATVPEIDDAAFQAIAEETKAGCPISGLVGPGLQEMTLTATRQ